MFLMQIKIVNLHFVAFQYIIFFFKVNFTKRNLKF